MILISTMDRNVLWEHYFQFIIFSFSVVCGLSWYDPNIHHGPERPLGALLPVHHFLRGCSQFALLDSHACRWALPAPPQGDQLCAALAHLAHSLWMGVRKYVIYHDPVMPDSFGILYTAGVQLDTSPIANGYRKYYWVIIIFAFVARLAIRKVRF